MRTSRKQSTIRRRVSSSLLSGGGRRCRAVLAVGLFSAFVLGLSLPSCAAPTAPTAAALSQEFSRIVKEVSPAVVSVTSVRMVSMRGMPRGRLPMPFGDLFGGGPNPFLPGSPEGEQRQEGLGSGVIVSEDGYVLTNNHVVADATELSVRLADKREFDAKVIGADPDTDIAVLKIDGSDLPTAKLGNSGDISVGNIVLAIGNPFGLDRTVTSGIISAKGRAQVGISEYEDFIQTDAAINPGNSGGPLVNTEGRVIGINTAIFSRSGGYMGVGFAVPINLARNVMEALISEGKVTRGWLGVVIQDLTPELADAMKLGTSEGVLVAKVMEDSPAEEAGMKRGDVVVRLGKSRIANTNELRNRVAGLKPGNEATFTVQRDGKEIDVPVTIGERPGRGMQISSVENAFGLRVQNVTEEMRAQMDIPEDAGVVVAGVQRGSSAAEAGLRPGTLILEANREAVRNVGEFSAVLKDVDAERGLLLLVSDRGVNRYVLLKPRNE